MSAITELPEAYRAEHARLKAEIDAMGPCPHDGKIAHIEGDDRSGFRAVCDLCLEPYREATRDEIFDASEAYAEEQYARFHQG